MTSPDNIAPSSSSIPRVSCVSRTVSGPVAKDTPFFLSPVITRLKAVTDGIDVERDALTFRSESARPAFGSGGGSQRDSPVFSSTKYHAPLRFEKRASHPAGNLMFGFGGVAAAAAAAAACAANIR